MIRYNISEGMLVVSPYLVHSWSLGRVFNVLSQDLQIFLLVKLIVILLLILMADLDLFHLLQHLVGLWDLCQPQRRNLVVPFSEGFSIVDFESLLSDLWVHVLKELLLDPLRKMFMLAHIFGLQFFHDNFLQLPLVVELSLLPKNNEQILIVVYRIFANRA